VRSAFDTAARAGQSGLTAKLEQFVDPGWDAGFASGSFATIACPSWMIGYIKGKAGDAGAGKWNVTTLPGGAGGNWGGSYLAIPASSQHKDEAAQLITWLTDPAQQAKVFSSAGNFPSTTGGIDLVSDATDPYFGGAPIGKIFTASAEAAPVQILGPEDGVVKNAMTQSLLAVETSGTSPADAWTAAAAKIQNQVG
jgi:cellobiose transport system substrate-binding protein